MKMNKWVNIIRRKNTGNFFEEILRLLFLFQSLIFHCKPFDQALSSVKLIPWFKAQFAKSEFNAFLILLIFTCETPFFT